jgi:hypothetical protein
MSAWLWALLVLIITGLLFVAYKLTAWIVNEKP